MYEVCSVCWNFVRVCECVCKETEELDVNAAFYSKAVEKATNSTVTTVVPITKRQEKNINPLKKNRQRPKRSVFLYTTRQQLPFIHHRITFSKML